MSVKFRPSGWAGFFIQLVIGILGLILPPVAGTIINEGDRHYHFYDGLPIEVTGVRGADRVEPGGATGGYVHPLPDPLPPRVELTNDGSVRRYFYIEEHSWGFVFVLSEEFCWIRGRQGGPTELPQVERLGTPVAEKEVLAFLKSDGLQHQMRAATDVVAVGLASCEGQESRELRRAEARAMQLVYWLRQAHPADHLVNLWRVNVGQHRGPCPGATALETRRQRPVLFVALVRKRGIERIGNQVVYEALGSLPDHVLCVEDYGNRGPLLKAN